MSQPLTRSEREMLKAIYRLTRAELGEAEAHTGVLATALKVSPSTVTATVKRLADSGFAAHKPYRGVELTAPGREAAISAIAGTGDCTRLPRRSDVPGRGILSCMKPVDPERAP